MRRLWIASSLLLAVAATAGAQEAGSNAAPKEHDHNTTLVSVSGGDAASQRALTSLLDAFQSVSDRKPFRGNIAVVYLGVQPVGRPGEIDALVVSQMSVPKGAPIAVASAGDASPSFEGQVAYDGIEVVLTGVISDPSKPGLPVRVATRAPFEDRRSTVMDLDGYRVWVQAEGQE